MGKNTNFIDINGQRFDAASGKPVGPASAAHRINTRQGGHSAKTGSPTMSEVVRRPAHHAAAHTPKNSQTLMRHAVKKPGKAKRHLNKPTAQTGASAFSTDMVVTPVAKVQSARLQHARQVRQSKLISHFSPQSQEIRPLSAPSASPLASAQPAAPAPTPPAARPLKPAIRQPATPSRPSTKHAKEAVLQRGLERATSHKQPARKAPRKRGGRKLVTSLAVVVALIGMGAAFVVTQPDSAQLALISAKAGFKASGPAQQITGYSLSRAQYTEGVVTLKYQNDDGVNYTVTQKRTDLNDDGLQQQFDAADPDSYKTISVDGKQAYIYGDQNVTWIQNGMWYVIQSNGKLTDRQLTDLAASL